MHRPCQTDGAFFEEINMSESQSAGGIHYDVAMDVRPLLVGERQGWIPPQEK